MWTWTSFFYAQEPSLAQDSEHALHQPAQCQGVLGRRDGGKDAGDESSHARGLGGVGEGNLAAQSADADSQDQHVDVLEDIDELDSSALQINTCDGTSLLLQVDNVGLEAVS